MVDATMGTTSATGAASTPVIMSLTCTTCITKFASKEAKREHMKSDWHVYNLKRHIAALSPISWTTFKENIVLCRTEDISSDDSAQFRNLGAPYEQRDAKQKTKRSHLKSRNYTRKSVEAPSPDIASSRNLEDSDSEGQDEQFNPRHCLFCNSEATSSDDNMSHMSRAHSFFIPDAEYLIDLESLLSYLFIIVSDFHECLYCGSIKSNKLAVQDHMRGKGHCKVDLEDEGHALKLFYDFAGDTDSDDESPDVEEEDVSLIPEEDELRLPSGKTLGHRSRVRNVRQRVPARASFTSHLPQNSLTEGKPEELPTEEIQSNDQRIMMRAGTSTSMIGIPEVQRRALVAVEQKMMKIEARKRTEYEAHVQRKGNQQKRFKVQSIGKKAGGLERRLG